MSEHESSSDKPRDIGLKAVRAARIERASSKHGRITGKAWLVALSAVVVVVGAAWLFRDRSLDNQKEDLLSKQRAALTTVGAEWFPIRDKIEKTTLEAAREFKGDYVDPEAASWDFRTLPGIYLRMRVEDAKDVAQIRKSADESARDSFVGCLFRENNPTAAATARGEADAGSGWNDQPWNLRLAYFATRILTDEWVDEVKNAKDEINLRVFVQQYDKAKDNEIPLAIDIVKKAQFFLLVLDEDVPEAKGLTTDAGRNAGKVTERELQQVPHPTRVHLLDLRRDKEMVRLRLESEADFRFAGERPLRDPQVLAAMKRQVNNCALAGDVWAAIKPTAAGDAGATGAGDAGAAGDAP
ncbi:MAG: hypothetical protein KF795_03360 [Labilithrix sp.]|nr:hypothetical protein [Labilithrix sp.]